MMPFVLFVLLVPFVPPEDPVDLAADPEVIAYFDDLSRRGFPSQHVESAAFLIKDDDGGHHCLLWPMHNGYDRQVFRGAIPHSAVAIAHTHTRHAPRPSDDDHATARATGLPVFVLTPTDIYAAMPDGRTIPVITNKVWKAKPSSPPKRCIRAN